ncbi:MAG: phage holin family protein [Rhizobiaceae bacterium]|nr:MAG: phage holin family protein [Rhizobiaceae bacterium]
MANSDTRPLGDLVSGLVADISGLFRKEIDLAKTEASAKISNAASGLGMLAVGLVLAVGAIGVLLAAIVNGLGAFLVAQGFTEANADAVASIVVADCHDRHRSEERTDRTRD